MTIIEKIKTLLRLLAENIHRKRRIVLALSCLVVFMTTYMLILPAFTLGKIQAAEQGGIDIPGVTNTVEEVSVEEQSVDDQALGAESSEPSDTSSEVNDTEEIVESGQDEQAAATSSDNNTTQQTQEKEEKTIPDDSAASKSDDSAVSEISNDIKEDNSVDTITEKEAVNRALKAKANSAGVFEEEVIVSGSNNSAPSGRRLLKSATRGLLGATNEAGTWDLADTGNTQFLHVSTDSSVTETEQERNAAFKLTFSYSLKEDVVRAIDNYDGHPKLVYDLSDVVANSPINLKEIHNGTISIGTRKLGTYKLEGNKVVLEFTDTSYFDGRTTFTGFFNLTAETDETRLGDNDEYTYTFPGTGDTVPIHYKKTVEEGTKNVNLTQDADGNYTLHYTANININTDLDSLKFTDTIGGLQTLDASSVKIAGRSVSVTTTGNGFTFDVAAALGTTGVAKGSYQVTYDTKVTADQLKAMTADKTTETNSVTWKVNGDKDIPGGETSKEIEKPKEPIPVTKTIDSTTHQPGDTVNYSVTYGNDKTDLSGFHISDNITDVVIPQGSSVTLNYNGQTVQVPFSSEATNSSYSKNMVTLFDYTFPEGTSGKGPVTVNYSVKLIDADTAKTNGVYDSTSVVNTALEHRQNTSDTKTTTVTYEKEPHYDVSKTAAASTTDGKWAPGSEITYTLTIGDANTNMAGVNIKDVMTDLQILHGDIQIKVGNGNPQNLESYAPGAIKWSDDGKYSTGDVTLFEFDMPSNAGNGPVVITYKTTVISQEQAEANDIYGDVQIRNTGYGGKDSDGTSGTGPFGEYPITKTVTQNSADVNHSTVELDSIVHYTLTFGKAGMDLKGVTVYDEMTDLQKLVGNITITKADGTSFTMPTGSGQWADNGVVWPFFDDEKYTTDMVRVFNYKLPDDIGQGPITIEYDAQIISEEEANNSGIKGDKTAYNTFKVNNHQAQTDVIIEFPEDPKHDTQVRKEFDHWDVTNKKLYWNIILEKTDDSAYPIENVKVRESNWGGIYITEKNSSGWYNQQITDFTLFDVKNAVVTTDDGTILTPGIDYTINKSEASFNFPILNERVHINLAFNSPIDIVDGYYMHNRVRLEGSNKTGEAEATFTNPKIDIVKNGTYTDSDRIVKWQVILNPSKKPFDDSNPIRVWFEDTIPNGLTLLNYSDKTENNPTLHVDFEGELWLSFDVPAEVDSNNKITSTDIAAHDYNGNPNNHSGVNKNKIIVTYYTKLSEEEWERITSSASGSEVFENHVDITAGDNQSFDATGKVTIKSDGFLLKEDITQEDDHGVVIDSAGENDKSIKYRVNINPNGYILNGGDKNLTLTDYIATNMDLDPDSVEIVDADGTAVEGLVISYNDDSRLLTIHEIPDATPLVLTYQCYARSQGTDTFNNTATLIGGGSHSSSVSEEHNIQKNDAGVKVDGIDMNLHKIDENNIKKDLEGAQFQLYECVLSIGDLTNPEEYNQSYWNDLLEKMDRITAGQGTEDEIAEVKDQFKIVQYKEVGDPAVTGETGFTQWTGLNEHKLYAWKEISAPDNYTGNTDYHYFVGYQHVDVNTDQIPQPLLPDEEQLNRKHAAWALDDACQLANNIRVASMANLTTWTATNIESQYTSIPATKEWEGDNDNLFETRPEGGITLQLWQIDSTGNRIKYGDPVAINVDPETGEWPSYIWNKLPLNDPLGRDYKYTVTETPVDGYSTTYSDNGEGIQTGGITVKNKLIPKNTNITVEKRFEIEDEATIPDHIKVTLQVIRTDKDGKVSEPEDRADWILNDGNEWKHTFEKLPTNEVIDGVPYTLKYTVVEDTAQLEREGYRYTVSYSDNNQGVIDTDYHPLYITNATVKGSVKVSKHFTGDDVGGILNDKILEKIDPDVFKITASWTENDEERAAEFSIAGELPENVTRTGSWPDFEWTIDNLPVDTVVTFEETGYDVDGYTVTVNGEATASPVTATAAETAGTAEFVNEYTKVLVGSLELQKYVKIDGFDPTDRENVPAADQGKADGTYTFTVTGTAGTATEGQTHEVQITINNGAAVSAKVDGADAALTSDHKVVISGMVPGEYTVTETGSTNTDTACISVISSNGEENLDEQSTTVIVIPDDSQADDNTVSGLVTFTNSTHTDEDVAHVSVRKTFTGLTKDELPEHFKITAKVTDNGNVHNYELTNSDHQPSGVIFNETVDNVNKVIVWDWEISIHGLTTEATVEVVEVNYTKDGYEVTSSVNGTTGTSASGTVSSDTVIEDLSAEVDPAQNKKIFPLNDTGDTATIFIARLTSDQTALVISKNKLNLSERKALEAQLKHMPNAQDWTHGGHQVLYYSFEDAKDNQIIVKGTTVTYSDENGGQIRFNGKYQWSMVAKGEITYKPGRPADFNFANDYTTGIDFNIIKVEKDNKTKTLPGAKFAITLLDDERTTSSNIVAKTKSDGTKEFYVESDATEDDGKIVFTDIKAGYYKIEETQRPEGYVQTEDTTFYIHVSGTGAAYLIRSTEAADADKKLNEWRTSTTGSGLVTYDEESLTATVENEFGAELPLTGGIGTTIFYILGSILVIGGGIYFISRRRVKR